LIIKCVRVLVIETKIIPEAEIPKAPYSSGSIRVYKVWPSY